MKWYRFKGLRVGGLGINGVFQFNVVQVSSSGVNAQPTATPKP